jgi:predicted DNA-binding transcriptional regulator
MELWGWKLDRTKGDYQVMRTDEGGYVKVFKPEISRKNPPGVLLSIYHMTGVDAEVFWRGPDREPQDAEPSVVSPSPQVSKRVYELLLAQARPMHIQEIAVTLGFTNDQVSGAIYNLNLKNLLQRVKKGFYLAVEQRRVSERQDVGINASLHESVQAVVQQAATAPSAPVEGPEVIETAVDNPEAVETVTAALQPIALSPHAEVTETDIYEILDMLVPYGFKAQDYPAVSRWVEVTKELVNGLRSRGR